MVGSLTIDLNGINIAYGIVALAIFYFVVSNIVVLFKMLRCILAVHLYCVKVFFEELRVFSVSTLFCSAFMAVVYISNYHIRGPDFSLTSIWVMFPSILVGLFALMMVGGVYAEAGTRYYCRNMTEDEVAAYRQSKKCQSRWRLVEASIGRRRDQCRQCDQFAHCSVGKQLLEG